jgi:hypothetical protein
MTLGSTAERRVSAPAVSSGEVQAYEGVVVSYQEAVHAHAIWNEFRRAICDRLAWLGA